MKVAGVDVFYTANKAFTGVVVMDEERIIEKRVKQTEIPYRYIPGMFSLREGPLILNILKDVKSSFEVLLCNGHGWLHPQKRGLATVVGEIENIATIGVTKELLKGRFLPPPPLKGCFSYVYINGEKRGVVVRSTDNGGVIFVSPGFKIGLDKAYKVVLRFLKFRLPEPLRVAHIISKRAGKGLV